MDNNYLEQAQRSLMRAQCIVEQTFPLTEEVKLLAVAVKELEKAWTFGMKAKGSTDSQHLKTWQEIHTLSQAREESPVEFTRNQALVICSENYEMTILNEQVLKNYIQKTESFLKQRQKHE